MIDIQAMRELLDASTKGEWRADYINIGRQEFGISSDELIIVKTMEQENAAFIAASHNNMAELLRLAEIGLKETARRTIIKLLPCKCGGQRRREYFRCGGPKTEFGYICIKCGYQTAAFATRKELRAAWNDEMRKAVTT